MPCVNKLLLGAKKDTKINQIQILPLEGLCILAAEKDVVNLLMTQLESDKHATHREVSSRWKIKSRHQKKPLEYEGVEHCGERRDSVTGKGNCVSKGKTFQAGKPDLVPHLYLCEDAKKQFSSWPSASPQNPKLMLMLFL